mgnify:CR=1 FL=1
MTPSTLTLDVAGLPVTAAVVAFLLGASAHAACSDTAAAATATAGSACTATGSTYTNGTYALESNGAGSSLTVTGAVSLNPGGANATTGGRAVASADGSGSALTFNGNVAIVQRGATNSYGLSAGNVTPGGTGTVQVSNLEAGATWEFSTNSGTTWTAGTGSSFTLAAGTYAAGAVQVRQTDVAGNSSVAGSAPALTVDATAPATLAAAQTAFIAAAGIAGAVAASFHWSPLLWGGAGNSVTYTLQPADKGRYLFYCVTPAAASGASPGLEVCTAATGPVREAAPQAVPSLSGSGVLGLGAAMALLGGLGWRRRRGQH